MIIIKIMKKLTLTTRRHLVIWPTPD